MTPFSLIFLEYTYIMAIVTIPFIFLHHKQNKDNFLELSHLMDLIASLVVLHSCVMQLLGVSSTLVD